MKKLAAFVAITALTSAFAASASASDIKVQVFSVDNKATLTVTKDGQPLANYPVEIQGINAMTNTGSNVTAENGSVTVTNYSNQPESVKFIVKDEKGQPIVARRFLGRDS